MAAPEKIGPGSIFCIEDYDGVRDLLGTLMEEDLKIPRERIVMIASRAEAERLLTEAEQTGQTPALVLLNFNLAGESGYPILDKIRKSKSPLLNCTPIIGMSTDQTHKQVVLARGANVFLSKPFHRIEEVEDTISLLLGTQDQAKAA